MSNPKLPFRDLTMKEVRFFIWQEVALLGYIVFSLARGSGTNTTPAVAALVLIAMLLVFNIRRYRTLQAAK